MSKKIYTMKGEAVDRNGVKHIVTMVGEYVQENEYDIAEDIVDVVDEFDEHKVVQGVLTYPTKKRKRTLTYSFSICHPDDEYNEDIGVKIAMRRIKRNPLGRLETNLITTLCKDQINLILFGELNYVIDNIDKYI